MNRDFIRRLGVMLIFLLGLAAAVAVPLLATPHPGLLSVVGGVVIGGIVVASLRLGDEHGRWRLVPSLRHINSPGITRSRLAAVVLTAGTILALLVSAAVFAIETAA